MLMANQPVRTGRLPSPYLQGHLRPAIRQVKEDARKSIRARGSHNAPLQRPDIRMQPVSCHHARDAFAQRLGPYTKIPVNFNLTGTICRLAAVSSGK